MRRSLKRWCCLFTCLATRAVHIEIVHSLDTESCLAMMPSFVARREQPKTILSDNGLNFVGAAKEFKKRMTSWNQQGIKEKLTLSNIVWKISHPGAPHLGGIWKRLVRSCKRAMIAVLGSRSITDEILSTTMCQVGQTLNARPLYPVRNDHGELEKLTLNFFLIGRSKIFQYICSLYS